MKRSLPLFSYCVVGNTYTLINIAGKGLVSFCIVR